MKLRVINSNSSGNAYLIQDDSAALLIECGVKFDEIKKASGFNLMKIKACLVTHEHKDHSKSVKSVLGSGIPVYMTKGTREACKLPIESINAINKNRLYSVVGFSFSAFKVDHEAADPVGYIINSNETGYILFATDLKYLRYEFPYKFRTVIIEANYCGEILKEVTNKKGVDFVNSRRLHTHMNFKATKEALLSMDLTECNNIVLIHLSDGLTDEKRFKKEVEELTGVPTHIAKPGLEINLNKNPF